ncbi:hypothetical protein CHS0354_025736 [Potamilus streckersoni]|uniref:Bax inhibitor 1 n=1 Tax=Potamilus streckersoni TaxID=2493646 RepID=A0AAE0SES1_9BIVA|nr:hypothetical protein CHS0354_025736 [Potamilus streckersoni]
MATRNGFVPEAVFKFDHLNTAVQNHLKRVYGCLAMSMFAAAAGVYIHLFTNLMQAGFITAIVSIGLMIWLASTHHSKENETKRIAIFTGFTFTAGMSLGPLLDNIMRIDPSIIITAFLGTSVIFISFSLAALYNQNRTFLYMGGFLLSALSWLVFMGLLNIFFGFKILYDLNLYGGLLLFCAFILYDTQLIIEKARLGDEDYIWHSVDLFLDFINIFRRLLIILAKKEDDKKRRN